MWYTEPVVSDLPAERWPDLPADVRVVQWRALPKHEADELFRRLSTYHQMELLLRLPPSERGAWLRLLPPDDATDLIQAAAGHKPQESLIDLLDDVGRREVGALLAYQQDRAGGLMNPRFYCWSSDCQQDRVTYVPFKRILCPVDTHRGGYDIRYAVQLADSTAAELHLLQSVLN